MQESPYTTFGSALAMRGLYRVMDAKAGPVRPWRTRASPQNV
ncbi:hypothetical protein [Rhodocytophaga rosea]|nr:hypothetical protein [Rhodocytophaga rosea]